jgi:glycosyltransferase involved in cell wall biosynthesis
MNRILIVGPYFYNYLENLVSALERRYEVSVLGYNIERKKNPIKVLNNRYKESRLNKEVLKKVIDEGIATIIMVRGYERIYYDTYKKVYQSGGRLILFLQDGFYRSGVQDKILPFFSRICLFEPNDKIILREKGYLGEIVTFGCAYNPNAYKPLKKIEEDIDISFVGNMHRKERMDLLLRIFKEFPERNILVFGRFYFFSSPISLFRWLKFPYKSNIVNGSFHENEVNLIYNRSKICLNIQHAQNSKGYNPRTVEIMASGAFQLSNFTDGMKEKGWGQFIGKYEDTEELINKLKLYLKNNNLRKAMAMAARKEVVGMEWTTKVLRII